MKKCSDFAEQFQEVSEKFWISSKPDSMRYIPSELKTGGMLLNFLPRGSKV